jgi:hypothetical protein
MIDLLIHIGRHKTGTTAIQRFLSATDIQAMTDALLEEMAQ